MKNWIIFNQKFTSKFEIKKSMIQEPIVNDIKNLILKKINIELTIPIKTKTIKNVFTDQGSVRLGIINKNSEAYNCEKISNSISNDKYIIVLIKEKNTLHHFIEEYFLAEEYSIIIELNKLIEINAQTSLQKIMDNCKRAVSLCYDGDCLVIQELSPKA